VHSKWFSRIKHWKEAVIQIQEIGTKGATRKLPSWGTLGKKLRALQRRKKIKKDKYLGFLSLKSRGKSEAWSLNTNRWGRNKQLEDRRGAEEGKP